MSDRVAQRRQPARGRTTLSERERLAGLLAGAREDRTRLRALEDRTRLRAQLDATEAELERVRRELARTTAWLHALERSRTWRLTAPIRRISGALRGRRRA